MLELAPSVLVENWEIASLALGLVVIEARLHWCWEDFKIEAVHGLERILRLSRHILRRAWAGQRGLRTEWKRNTSYTIDDFRRHWKRAIDLSASGVISPGVEDWFWHDAKLRWGLLESFLPWFLDDYDPDHAWDYAHRLVAVLDFLHAHRGALIATPEGIITANSRDNQEFSPHIKPLFIDHLLGGFEDPILPGQEAWHPLMTNSGQFPYEETLAAFRDWVGEKNDLSTCRNTKG